MISSTMQDFPLTIGAIMRHGASIYGGSEVLTWTGDGARRGTFKEIADNAARLASALSKLGIEPNDPVGTLAWNNQEHMEAYFAVPGMGAVLHTLNIRLPPPQIAHIMAGTNDIAGNTGRTTEQDFKNNITAMVDLARAHHIQVALASILPASAFSWKPGLTPASTIVRLNSWLRDFALKSHIRYIDYYSELADAHGGFIPALSNDGVHPNRDGYAVMRKLTLAGIAK